MTAPSPSSTDGRLDDTVLHDLRVVGGRQRAPAGMRELDGRWYGYGSGVIVDLDRGEAKPKFEYQSAPGTHGPEDPILLKSATVSGDRVYACTQTEVLVRTWPDFEPVAHLSLPIFNDVHHVIPGDAAPGQRPSTVLVAVSGLDAVAEVGLDGTLVDLISVTDERGRPSIDPERDYRISCDLKPHAIHPNYLFRIGDEVWATRFETRDAVAVHDPSRRIAIDRERCHDGVVHDGRVFFTTVDGHVIEVDADTLAVRAEHQLTGPNTDTLLGWCRGLTFLDDVHVAVGFSRIRHTRFRNTLSFVRNGMTRSEPTRVAVYDSTSWALVDEVDVEGAGCNAVFSILPVTAERTETSPTPDVAS